MKPLPENRSDPTRSGAPARVAPDRLVRFALAACVFLAPLTLYLRTLAPTIYPGDGAELTAAAWCLGVPHPTGYPLFMVLGYAFQHLGLGSPAFSMNVLCALFGAFACVGVYRFQRELWRHLVGRSTARRLPWRFAAAALALAMGAASGWWDQSNTTEVYSLMLLFVAWTWAAGLRLARRPTERGLWSLAFLSGLGFLHHQLFLVTLPLSAMGLVVFWRRARDGKDETGGTVASEAACSGGRHARSLAVAVLLFAVPLLGYAYLPLRAAAGPRINSGNPRGLSGLTAHLSGGQYRATRILTRPDGSALAGDEIAPHISRRLGEIARWMGRQYIAPPEVRERSAPSSGSHTYVSNARGPLFAMICGLLAAMGLYALWQRSPWAAAGLAGGLVLNLAVVLLYTIADIAVYQLPLWLLVGALATLGPTGFAESMPVATVRSEAPRSGSRLKRIWATGIATLALGCFGVYNWMPQERMVNKAQAHESRDFAQALLQIAEPNAVVFTSGDFDIYPLWYAQTCECLRPDVAVVGSNFVFSRWYAAMLCATLPEGVEVFIGDEPPPKTSGRWLVAFLGGMVAPQIQAGRPTYITLFAGDEKRAMIERHYTLEPLARFSTLTPWADGPPLLLYRISDPNGFSARAIATLGAPENFPNYRLGLVRASAKP